MAQETTGLDQTRPSASTQQSSTHQVQPREAPPLKWQTILICWFPSFGGMLFGYDSGYIAGVLAMAAFKLQFGQPGSSSPDTFDGYAVSTDWKSLIVSILSAGTAIGAVLSGGLADMMGRKHTVMLGSSVYAVGVALQVIASHPALLTAGRAVAGLGVGAVSGAIITYISEITPKKIRGPMLSAYQFSITAGLFTAAGINLGTKDLTSSAAYRIPIGIQFVWALILFIGLCFMPESPRYFVREQNADRAAVELSRILRQPVDSTFVQNDLRDLVTEFKNETEGGGWLDLFRGGLARSGNLRGTSVGMMIQILQQLTGVNFIFYFGTTFFVRAGIEDSFTISLIVSAINFGCTPISSWSIERCGRRKLLIWGAVGMSISQLIIAIVGTISPDGSRESQIVLIVFVCFFIAIFAATWGPTAWAVSAESFPLSVRSKGVSLCVATNWLWNFAIAFATPYLVDKKYADLGAKIFFIWGSCNVFSIIFGYFFVYETKGLSLEEITQMRKECSPRGSPTWAGRQGSKGVVRRGRRSVDKIITGEPKASHDSALMV